MSASYEFSKMISISVKSYSVKTTEKACPRQAKLFKGHFVNQNPVAGRLDERVGGLKE